ncbi:TPA: hypothetical protein ACXF9M_003778 [Escherichia coli]|uniref:hypothetical protein n=2 Tax=Escherichia coli TaxID=562 RepID=UPI001159BBFA|nr:hypothetical protein [Escherichia coli]ELP1266849.1 hypothetical protein [Escherichia coli]MED8584982.1 hypothetical protein [Escherichia coli]MED8646606.1 hypothetical protein [Escherichia coli]NPM07781.1 hypothetical protein [Escherichia coli]HAN7070071.1 hypothetical protein [Escherichia coli]
MTLGALLALCKSFSMQKSTVLCANAAKRVKKQQTEKKDQKSTCAKNWDPYNAPPLRRQREILHKMVVTTKRKNPEIQG